MELLDRLSELHQNLGEKLSSLIPKEDEKEKYKALTSLYKELFKIADQFKFTLDTFNKELIAFAHELLKSSEEKKKMADDIFKCSEDIKKAQKSIEDKLKQESKDIDWADEADEEDKEALAISNTNSKPVEKSPSYADAVKIKEKEVITIEPKDLIQEVTIKLPGFGKEFKSLKIPFPCVRDFSAFKASRLIVAYLENEDVFMLNSFVIGKYRKFMPGDLCFPFPPHHEIPQFVRDFNPMMRNTNGKNPEDTYFYISPDENKKSKHSRCFTFPLYYIPTNQDEREAKIPRIRPLRLGAMRNIFEDARDIEIEDLNYVNDFIAYMICVRTIAAIIRGEGEFLYELH
ncbi:MAG: hypothetical protein QW303_00545 [Nitrososphaerota archaeon]